MILKTNIRKYITDTEYIIFLDYFCTRYPKDGGMAELVECTGLENRRTRKGTGGSNPSSSAHLDPSQIIGLGLIFL